MKEITFTVSVDEANIILEGIGSMPFVKVYALVAKLQQQAKQQLENEAANAGQGATATPIRAVGV